jgi:hypothetical protein
VQKRLLRLWGFIRQLLSVRGLLDWLGWKQGVGTALTAVLLTGWGWLEHLPGPELVVIALLGCAFLIISWRGLSVNWAAPVASDLPRICIAPEGLRFDEIKLTTPLDRPILDASGKIASVGSRQYHCLKLYLKNDPLVVSNESNTAVTATIVFHDVNEHEYFRMDGRWADGPQPGQTSLIEMLTAKFAAGETRELDLVLKYVEEEDCYAMNHTSYEVADLGFRHPKRKLPAGEIGARIYLKGLQVNLEIDVQFTNEGRGGYLVPGSCRLKSA